MRGWTMTIVLVLCAGALIALFHFLFQRQMNKRIDDLQAQAETLQKELDSIVVMEAEIPKLRAQIPLWTQKIRLYEAAIPTTIDDDVFFGNLADELREQGVTVLGAEVTPGGPWLGNLNEDDEKEYTGIGVDVSAARQLKVAFYSIRLMGPYDRVLTAVENMKKYRRIYSIDEVIGPAGGGSGTVMENQDEANTPIQITGKIFYGMPGGYISDAEIQVALQAAFRPVSHRVGDALKARAAKVADGKIAPTAQGGSQ